MSELGRREPEGVAPEGPTPSGEATVTWEEEPVPRAGPVAHLVAAVVPVALGAACLAYSLSLSVGTPTSPGPGLWPALASLLLIGAGLWSLVFDRRVRDSEQFTRGARGIALGIASLVAYVLLLSRVGFEIPTLLLLALWLKVLGKESWRVTALVSVLSTASFYIVFVLLLGVPLPRLI